MSDRSIEFLNMFSVYKPPSDFEGFLKNAVIKKAEINQAKREISLKVFFNTYIKQKSIRQLERETCKVYDINKLQITPCFPEECIKDLEFDVLADSIISAYPPAAAILAGAKWEMKNGQVDLHLKANGKEELSRYLSCAESLIENWFGVKYAISVASNGEMSAKELFEKTEQLRQKTINETAAIQSTGQKTKEKAKEKNSGSVIFGRAINGSPMEIAKLNLDISKAVVCGEVFSVDHRELKNRGAYVVNFSVTDYTGSVCVSRFMESAEAKPIISGVRVGMWVKVQGKMNFNRYDNDMVLEPYSIVSAEKPVRSDGADKKRVELHLHTRMSAMDALTDTAQAVSLAASWGHQAIGITDHGVVQSFPDAMKAGKKNNIKILYGCEAYFINDIDDRIVVHGSLDTPFSGEFVAFDIETTGLSAQNDVITEIGAVVYNNGELKERFQTFVNPKRPLTQRITELTGITDNMLKDAPDISEALPEFLKFVNGRPLAAHNADFDIGFITAACQRLGIEFEPTSLDTLVMAQNLLPHLKKYKLDIVADALSLPEFNHHRAVDDAVTVGHMLKRFFQMLQEKEVDSLQQINPIMQELRSGGMALNRHARHMIIYAKNQTGLRNLYKLVSLAHLDYFKRVPRIPKSELNKYREGLIIGTACESGELFQAIVNNKSWSELERIAEYYDFLEIQPLCNNEFMLNNGTVETSEDLMEFNRKVVRLGEELNKPVVATGDVHFLNPEDEIYRKLLLASKGYDDADRDLPLYFKTTEEMLEEFSYLGAKKAYEVVVSNTNLIADICEPIRPVPEGLFAPKIENSVEELKSLVYGKMKELYGGHPPDVVTKRVETELGDIISCEYDVIYMSAQKLVAKSLEDGYLVGSRGSVGSSIVAYLSGITEVNSFPAHYRCPNCKHSDFDVPEGYSCGADLPDAVCPVCNTPYVKDGFDIPFETFLGFGGDKVPDIDLNFSGEYQAKAHKNTFSLFGEDHVFRAGTIGTVAEKTAYGYAKKYLEERQMTVSKAEENRLAKGCVGVKRTTGQHPGGLVVIPADKEIYDFCPVQHPADSTDTDIITTHFEYHSMEENLLKLDLLGHDDPTMIRMLEDLTGVDVTTIPLDDPDTMSLFTATKALGIENDPVLGRTGACAIPEFGTKFVREMLLDTEPRKFETLVQISGFSHGTDVWLNNAKDLLVSKTAKVNELISCRDDIMLYLIFMGLEEKLAFKIMESVRKGKGLQDEWIPVMEKAGVPKWYIDSCNKIKYLFPKAHAVAYVLMAFRIAWFKTHYPKEFYAAYFSIRAVAFDAQIMTMGIETVMSKMKEIGSNPNPSAIEKDMLVTLEVCYEFYKRGFSFDPISIYDSDATKFLVTERGLLPPFTAIAGLGETAARNIAEGRKGRQFVSIEEFSSVCTKVSKTHIEQMKAVGALGELPDTSQITLFA